MSTPELEEKFDNLHQSLFKVFERQRQCSNDIVTLYNASKDFLERIVEGYEEDLKTERETTVELRLYEQQSNELAAIMKGLNSFLEDYAAFMNKALPVSNEITASMQAVIDVSHQLNSPGVPVSDAEASLNAVQSRANEAAKSATEITAEFPRFSDQYNELQTRYAEWLEQKKALEDFDVFAAKQDLEDSGTWDNFHFYLVTFKEWHQQAKTALQQVMQSQFPEFNTHTHPAITDYMESINSEVAEKVIMHCKGLLQQQAEGMVPAEKYGDKLERWRQFYFNEEGLELTTDADRRPGMSDEEWEEHKKAENENTIKYNKWCQRRKKEWYDAMQPLNFKYLPALSDIEGDYWLLYAINMRDDYEEWKTWSETLHTFLSYDLDPELLNGEAKVWRNKMTEIYCSWSAAQQKAHHAEWEKKWLEEE